MAETAYPRLNVHEEPPMLTEWCDTTWYQWMELHDHWRKGFGMQFPRKKISPQDRARFHVDVVSGRLASPHRQMLKFYEDLDDDKLRDMKGFLNYVMFTSNTIISDEIPLIARCLASRDSKNVKGGRAPVFGCHETFQVGHWYVLLSSRWQSSFN